MDDNEEQVVQRKPFSQFILEQRRGGLHGELSDALAELVSAVDEQRRSGTLTLTIQLVPNSDGVTVTVSDAIKIKAPEAKRGAAIFYVGANGALERNDPRQMQLPVREVPRADADSETA